MGFAGTPEEHHDFLLERNTGVYNPNRSHLKPRELLTAIEQQRLDAASEVMADALRERLAAIRTGRAGNPATRKTTNIIVKSFEKVRDEEFPHLVGHVFHLAGGTLNGDDIQKVSEIHSLDPNAPKGKATLWSTAPDSLFGTIRPDGKPDVFAGINGASVRKRDNMLTSKEQRSFENMVRLIPEPGLTHWVAKLETMEQDDSKTWKESENAARVVLIGIEQKLRRLGKYPGRPSTEGEQ